MASTLSDNTATSASLDHLEAQCAPTKSRAHPAPLGSLPWPQQLASGRPKVEDFPLSTTRPTRASPRRAARSRTRPTAATSPRRAACPLPSPDLPASPGSRAPRRAAPPRHLIHTPDLSPSSPTGERRRPGPAARQPRAGQLLRPARRAVPPGHGLPAAGARGERAAAGRVADQRPERWPVRHGLLAHGGVAMSGLS